MRLIFLDIDGCLNRQHFGKDESSKFGFDDRCVSALKYVVSNVPDCRIVVTSAWRNFDVEPRVDKTLPWRKVLETRLERPGIIVGATRYLENIVGKNGSRLTRADEIDFYMSESRDKIDAYVIIDDECSCYAGTELADHVVDCEIGTGRGLDEELAEKAVKILTEDFDKTLAEHAAKIFAGNSEAPDMERVSAMEYESLFDDARNMAYTLKQIDDEIRAAARCEGNHCGGYPPERLLPSICKIMYACLVDFRNERYR